MFQKNVGMRQASGGPGDFASANPHSTIASEEGQIVAAAGGVTMGQFCFVKDGAASGSIPATLSGSGGLIGFVGRGIFPYAHIAPNENGVKIIPEGLAVTVYDSGDFWISAPSAAKVGQSVFAKAGGVPGFADGDSLSGYTKTGWIVSSAADAGGMCIISKR